MKFTPSDILEDETPSVSKRPKAKPKKQRQKPAAEPEGAETEGDTDIEAEEMSKPKKQKRPRRQKPKPAEAPEEIMEEEEYPEEDGGVPERGGISKVKLFLVLLVMAVGLGLVVVNVKGLIDNMRLEQTEYNPSKDFDKSYQESLDAEPEEFEDTNHKRKEAPPQSGADGTSVPGDDLGAEGSPSKQAEQYEQEIQELKNAAALMEQELHNCKTYLDESLAREAQLAESEEQLRNQVEALGGTVK